MDDERGKLRLNQAIAKTGFCSRRKADQLIAEGRVQVNNQLVGSFNTAVDPLADQISIDGKALAFKTLTYVLMNKPPGVVTTTTDDQDRQTVIDLLPPRLRHLKPVGRLDMYSEGLLVLTNDGELALKLTHPRHHVGKLYLVLLEGCIQDRQLKQLRNGILLEDGMTLPAGVRLIYRNKSSSELEIILSEGRNRQIRRMFASLGYRVRRLVRLAVGRLQLGNIDPGAWRYLTSQEVSELLSQSTVDA